MYALVESGSITKIFTSPKGFVLNNNQYPQDIFYKWTKDEKEAIGIYEIETDSTNRKDEKWYINTNESYTFGSGKVTRSWGTATAKKHADTLYTSQDKTDGKIPDDKNVGDVAVEGLKTIKKRMLDEECASILAPSDWRVVKEQETGDNMNSGWKTWRGNVRTKCNSMQTQIDNAANVDALAALFAYVNTADEGDPIVMARPLGEFPVKS